MAPSALQSKLLWLCGMLVIGCQVCPGADPNLQWAIPENTLSPNGRYGVTVPTMTQIVESKEEAKNVLVEVASKKPVYTFEGTAGASSAARYEAVATWSPDSMLLYWVVMGKWFESTQMLLKLKDDKVLWQLNLRETVEKAILQRTKEASPKTYEIKKKENDGFGSAYPEGFTVFIKIAEEKALRLPLHIRASLTSDPKSSRLPEGTGSSGRYNLESELDGVVDPAGKFTETRFKLLQEGGADPTRAQ